MRRKKTNMMGIVVLLGLFSQLNAQTYDAVPIGTPFLRPLPSPRAEPERPNIPRGYQPPPRPSNFEPPRSYNRQSQQQQQQPNFNGQNRNFNPPPAFRPPSINIDQQTRFRQNPTNWQMQQLQQQHPQRFQQRLPPPPAPLPRQNIGAPGQMPRFQIDPINNIIIHLYLNAKDKMSHAEIKTPVRGLFGIGTSHGGPGSHADPIVITKDFDRDTLEFVDNTQANQMTKSNGPSSIIEVKATVSTPNRQLENTVNKAVNQELDRAIPKVVDRMRGSMTMDNAMRKELEEALVDELAKNLGDTIDNTDITEEDLGALIEEGFNEVTRTEPTATTTTSRPTTSQKPTTTTTTTERWTKPTQTEPPPPTTTTLRWTRPTTTTTSTTSTTTTTQAPPSWFNHVTEQSNDDDDYVTELESEDISKTTTPSTTIPTTTKRVIVITTPTTTARTTTTTTRRVWTAPTSTTTTTTSTPSVRTTTTKYYTNENGETEGTTTYGNDGHVHFVPGFKVTETTPRATSPTTPTTSTTRTTTTTTTTRATTPPTTPAPTTTSTASTPYQFTDSDEEEFEVQTTRRLGNTPTFGGPPLSDKLVTRRPMIEVSPSLMHHHTVGVVSLASGEDDDSTSSSAQTVTSQPISMFTNTQRPMFNLPTKPSSAPVLHPSTFSPPLVTETETISDESNVPSTTTTASTTTEVDMPTDEPSFSTTTKSLPITSTTPTPTTSPTTTTTFELPFSTDDFTFPTESLTESSSVTTPIQVEPHTKFTEEPFSTNGFEWNAELPSGTTTVELNDDQAESWTPTTLVTDSGETSEVTPKITTVLTHQSHPSPVVFGSSEEDYDYTSDFGVQDVFTTTLPTTSTTTTTKTIITETFKQPETSTNTIRKPNRKPASSSSEEIQPTVVLQKGPCPTPNQGWDRNKSDVLFLLDSSDAFNEEKFHRAIDLIGETVKQFNNFGPDGTQVSLVQYNDEPYLEFSLRKHNCKKHLLDDIADTEYMTGGSQLGKALSKVSQFAFTKKRGDRADAENVLIIVTDGQSDDRVQQPMKLAIDNNVTVLVISSIEADKEYVNELAGNRAHNTFGFDDNLDQDLSWKLARRIAEVSKSPTSPPPLTPVHPSEVEEEATQASEDIAPQEKSNSKSNDIESSEGVTASTPPKVVAHGHQNEFIHLECVAEGFKIKVTPPVGFHGVAVVKGYQDDVKCKSTATSQGEVNMFIANNECGVTQVKSFDPKGLNSSLVLHLLHDKELNTGEDRAFLLQCFVGTPQDTELSTNLDVVRSELTIAETISLSTLIPTCTYSIRKNNPDGPIIAKANVGQTVYHRWDCDGSNETTNAYGIQIHSCYASDDVERKFAFVDPRGCSSDLALLSDLTYDDDSLTAYAASHVFSVHNAESLKFVCKLSLCTRDGDGCEGVTPPACGNNNNQSELLFTKRLARNKPTGDDALTSALSTQVGVSPNSTEGLSSILSSLATNQFFWIVAIAAIAAVVLISIVSRNHSDADTATTCSDPTSSSMSDPQEFGSVHSVHSGNAQPNQRLAEFMRSFDRNRYV